MLYISIDLRHTRLALQYACRKTLADSRPRVKGRFARGGGETCADQEAQVLHKAPAAGILESELPSVVTAGEASNSTSMPEWWLEMQEALATGVDLDYLYDEEMLTVSSISLYSPSSTESGQ
jgi:hypothetical protein